MENLEQVKKAILAEIRQARHILVIGHAQPDGDAAGACLSIVHYLTDLKKDFTCVCLGALNPYLKFLPKSEMIGANHEIWKDKDFDLMLVLDSGDLKHAGLEPYLNDLTQDFKIINIDHHVTNTKFGHYNLVRSSASSTCELIHELLDGVHLINKGIATCLLTGIITDTNAFSNLATSASAIETAAKLLLKGANLQQITNYTLNHRPFQALKLWGRALERLVEDPKTGVVSTVITQNDLLECQADEEAREGIANFLGTLDNNSTKAIMVFSEKPNHKIKVSLRTNNPLLNVAEFAKLMGGGGHVKAAGFEMDGTIKITPQGWKIA